ncbi:sensor histidine kinase [Gordonia polyisoprenivorans]|uniref:sensor histidine kinase n=1 Tax=Gordonia polyisoprenivorans TaxID=84595 RepID=UPI001AD69318|nr:histidine kinase [Gordonia polyisoprenivorans]QTI66759.1 two-component sensor histidine kinase [Gordonia polyisoprenivorans]
MRWLEAHYRHALVMFGFDYPTSYMLISDLGVFTLAVAAVVQRVVVGLSGTQWIPMVVAVALALGPHLACLYGGWQPVILRWKPWILGLPAFTLAAVVCFWQVPVEVDVATLLLPLCATLTAAVATRREAIISTIALSVTAVGGGLAGVIAQAWLFVLMVGFGGVVGYLLQKQLLLLHAERRAQEQQMALDRAEIAGEVHDVLAHSLSIMMLNVTAARRALQEHDDVADAVEALVDAEQVGRATMQDVRRTVELLRTSDAESSAPQPGFADLADLVDGFRRAGVDLDAEIVGNAETITGGTGLAVYRVVQESLSNAARHAPRGTVTVRVGPEPGSALVVCVRNPVSADARRALGGSGLSGMASRVENCGGAFAAGVVDGHWCVDARFPMVAVAGPGAHAVDAADGPRESDGTRLPPTTFVSVPVTRTDGSPVTGPL